RRTRPRCGWSTTARSDRPCSTPPCWGWPCPNPATCAAGMRRTTPRWPAACWTVSPARSGTRSSSTPPPRWPPRKASPGPAAWSGRSPTAARRRWPRWIRAPPVGCWTAGWRPASVWPRPRPDPAATARLGPGARACARSGPDGSGGLGVADGERGLEVVPGVGAERDVRLGVGHAGHPVQPARDDLVQFLVGPYPDHCHQIELAGDRVDLTDLRDLDYRFRRFRDARHVGSHQDDRGDHVCLLGRRCPAIAGSVPPGVGTRRTRPG